MYRLRGAQMAAPDHDDPFGNDGPPPEAYFGDFTEGPELDEYGFAKTRSGESSPPTAGGDPNDPNSDAAFEARQLAREKARNDLNARLNERQAEAVNGPNESVLVLAGAGSGKTSVLTARIASLVANGFIPAREVLAVTFTNKAAQEMRHRLTPLLDKRSVQDIWSGTFHSLCNKILRENFEAAGLPKAFAILDVDGQEALCRGILKDFGLTKSSVKEAAKAKAAAAKSSLELADPLAAAGGLTADDVEDDGDANEFVTPGQCAKYISARKEALEKPKPPAQVTVRSTDVEQMEAVYFEYQARCQRSGLLDFQDLLTRGVELLEKNEQVRDSYRRRFRAILVDEFQDTNDIQYRWLELMKGPAAHVMAVGDDSQSIYGFRGANPKNMQRFVDEMTVSKSFPEGRVVKLEQNYRSLPHILEAANAVIDRNPNQLKKTLFTDQRDRGEKIDLVTFGNGLFEASAVADSIHRLVKQHNVPPAEIAVLYRTNMQSRLIEQEMNKRGLPVTVYGGYRFYERQEIKNILAYLDLICDVSRDLSFARVVNFPPRGIGERTIEELRQDAQAKRKSMIELIGDRSEIMAANPASLGNVAAQKKQRQLEGFVGIILDLSEKALEQPLSQLIESVMQRAGIEQHYMDEAGGAKSSQEEAEERLANIGELVSAAKQFELDNPELKTAAEQLPEYLAYIALMTSTSESDMSKKATVSLMTVHSSKGLEFDHVFLVGLEEATFPHSRAIQEDEEAGNGKSFDDVLRANGATHDDDGTELVGEEGEADPGDGEGMQEERRLMYVAITRARKTLTCTYANERMLNGETKACEPSRFIQEIPEHRLNFIDDSKARAGHGKKPFLRDTSNREYGGDAFDETRTAFRRPPAKASKSAEPVRISAQTSFDSDVLETPAAYVGAGSIRVVSKRRNGVAASPDETVVEVDRKHTALGNRHFLNDHNDDEERKRVIEAYGRDFDADLAAKGPMHEATMGLAHRVAGGERIALACWCAPNDCHADLIAAKVVDFARLILESKDAPAPRGEPAPVPAPAPASATSGQLKPWQLRGSNAIRSSQSAPPARPQLSLVPSVVAGAARVVAVIGTAGRDKGYPMTADLWGRMVADAHCRVRPDDTLVSGGAAWADHLAVRMFLDGAVKNLVLHLPAPFKNGQFQGPEKSAGQAANFYHRNFKATTGVDGLSEIAQAIAKGATVTEQPAAPGYGGMFARNAIVAKMSTAALAYTFGGAEEPPNDSGTKNTWDQIQGERIHVPLLSLGPVSPSRLPARPSPAQATPGGSTPTSRYSPSAKTMERIDLLKRRPRP
ncbi:superfamily I DNA/RNA helicase [Roseateles asaccharophilus]|uniref:UvrD-helicase domain-containing protein n=1 Tax=Roseateles asaccharophilus TaxID=582607 RepID=UPI0038396E57